MILVQSSVYFLVLRARRSDLRVQRRYQDESEKPTEQFRYPNIVALLHFAKEGQIETRL